MILVNDNCGKGMTEVAIFSTPQEQAKSRDTPKYAKTFYPGTHRRLHESGENISQGGRTEKITVGQASPRHETEA
jgi:hypothetical protein